MTNISNYRDARICRNCRHSEVRSFGRGRSIYPVGYFCTLHDKRCCKTKVCDDHEWLGEFDEDEES